MTTAPTLSQSEAMQAIREALEHIQDDGNARANSWATKALAALPFLQQDAAGEAGDEPHLIKAMRTLATGDRLAYDTLYPFQAEIIINYIDKIAALKPVENSTTLKKKTVEDAPYGYDSSSSFAYINGWNECREARITAENSVTQPDPRDNGAKS